MDNNIFSFVNNDYYYIKVKNIIRRIIGLIIYSFIMIIYIEMQTPQGFDLVSFTANYALPYTYTFSIFALVISLVILLIYKSNKYWTPIIIRGVTYLYISILSLICSLSSFNGKEIYIEYDIFMFIQLVLYLSFSMLYLLILTRKIIPNFEAKKNENNLKYGLLACVSVIVFRTLMRNSNYNSDFISTMLCLAIYILSIIFAIKGIEFLVKAFYAKKYWYIIAERLNKQTRDGSVL